MDPQPTVRPRWGISRLLRVVLRLDAMASTAMPLLLAGTIPLLLVLDVPGGVVGVVLVGWSAVLGSMGAVIAGILATAARADGELPDMAWFLDPVSDRTAQPIRTSRTPTP